MEEEGYLCSLPQGVEKIMTRKRKKNPSWRTPGANVNEIARTVREINIEIDRLEWSRPGSDWWASKQAQTFLDMASGYGGGRVRGLGEDWERGTYREEFYPRWTDEDFQEVLKRVRGYDYPSFKTPEDQIRARWRRRNPAKRKNNPYTPEEFHEIAKGMGFTVPELEGEMIHRRNKLIEFVDQGGGDMVFYRQEMHKIARFNSLLKQLGYAKKFPANTPDRWKREDKRMDSSAFYDSKVPWRRKNTNKGIPIGEFLASPEYAAEMEDWRKEVQRRKGVGRQIAALTSGPKELREILGMMRDDEGSLDPKQEWTTNFKVYQGYGGHEIEPDKFVGTKHQLAIRLADRPNEEDEIESITDSQGNEYTFHCEDPTLLSDTETSARWNPNPARHRRRNPTKRRSRRNPYTRANRVTNYSTLKRGDLIVAKALQPGPIDAIYLVLGNEAGELRLYNVKVQEYLANEGDIPKNVDTCFTLSPTPKNLIYHRAGASLEELDITQLVSADSATQATGRLMLDGACNLLIENYLDIPTSFDD